MKQESIVPTLPDKLGIEASHLDALRHSLKDDLTPVVAIIQEWSQEIRVNLSAIFNKNNLNSDNKEVSLGVLIADLGEFKLRVSGDTKLSERVAGFCVENMEWVIEITGRVQLKIQELFSVDIDFSSAHVFFSKLLHKIREEYVKRIEDLVESKRLVLIGNLNEIQVQNRRVAQLELQFSLRPMQVQAKKGAEAWKAIPVALAGAQESFRKMQDGISDILHRSQEMQRFPEEIMHVAGSLNQAAFVGLKETKGLQESLSEC